jgi:hypothetical protein
MAETLSLAGSNSFVTHLKITLVVADTIGLSYNTMPGNMPNTYGNFVAIWQNQNKIPWNQKPLAAKAVPTNTQQGDMVFDGLDITNNHYILGYSVGPELIDPGLKYGNICSTAFVPTKANEDPPKEYQYFQTHLVLKYLGTTSVAVQFFTPPGCQPATNKNWMGLWRGETASYNNPPDYAVPITIDANSGTAAFNDVTIGRGLTYTIGYFMSGWAEDEQARKQTALACSLRFTNS